MKARLQGLLDQVASDITRAIDAAPHPRLVALQTARTAATDALSCALASRETAALAPQIRATIDEIDAGLASMREGAR